MMDSKDKKLRWWEVGHPVENALGWALTVAIIVGILIGIACCNVYLYDMSDDDSGSTDRYERYDEPREPGDPMRGGGGW